MEKKQTASKRAKNSKDPAYETYEVHWSVPATTRTARIHCWKGDPHTLGQLKAVFRQYIEDELLADAVNVNIEAVKRTSRAGKRPKTAMMVL